MAGLSSFPYRGASSSREWACESGFCRFPDFGLYRSGTADRRVTPPFPLDYFLRHPGQLADPSEPVLSGWFFAIERASWRQVDSRIASAGSGRPPRHPGLEGDSVDSWSCSSRPRRQCLTVRLWSATKATAVFLGDAGAARLVCGNLFPSVRLNLQQNIRRLSGSLQRYGHRNHGPRWAGINLQLTA
jgi:hypothetical protein